MVEQDTRQDVLKMVKAMIFKHSMNGVTSIAEIGSQYEESKSVEVQIQPALQLDLADKKPDVGSNAELIPEANNLIVDAAPKENRTKMQNSSAIDNQSVMVTLGANLYEQMSRLDMAPTAENWDSMTKFLQKAKLLDECEASAMQGN